VKIIPAVASWRAAVLEEVQRPEGDHNFTS
jgi:hypothetical protein